MRGGTWFFVFPKTFDFVVTFTLLSNSCYFTNFTNFLDLFLQCDKSLADQVLNMQVPMPATSSLHPRAAFELIFLARFKSESVGF